MKITSPDDLNEIYRMLVFDPKKARDLLGLYIKHSEYGDGTIVLYAPINGLVEVQFEDIGIKDIGPSDWENGRIISVWMEQAKFKAIRLYNQTVDQNGKYRSTRKSPPTYTADEVQIAILYQKIIYGNATDSDLMSFAVLVQDNPSSEYRSKIPNEFLFHPLLFSTASLEKQIPYVLSLLKDSSDPSKRSESLGWLVDLVGKAGFWQYFPQIPDAVLLEPEIWSLCPDDKKVLVLIRQIQSLPQGGDARHGFISELTALLALPKASQYWEQIQPSLYEEPEIYSILPLERKVPFLVKKIQRLDGSIEKRKWVQELAEIFSQAKDLSRWVSTIPEPIIIEPEIWRIWPAEKKVPILLRKIDDQPSNDFIGRELIIELAELMKLPQISFLWQTIPPKFHTEPEIYVILPPDLKVPLLVKIIQTPIATDQRNIKIRELAGVLSRVADLSLWRFLYEYEDLILEAPLIEVAPFEVKLRLFKIIITGLFTYELKSSFNDIPLEDDDLCLAGNWLQRVVDKEHLTAKQIRNLIGINPNLDDELSRVLSARAAELAVKRFLEQLGYLPEDTSILQYTSPLDERWKNYDLLVNTTAIDVKNARSSTFNPKIYVDYCVPGFKLNRAQPRHQQVLIAGVFSRNLLPQDILHLKVTYSDLNQNIQVLGMTSYSKLEALKKKYQRRGKFKFYFRRDYLKKESFLPPWVFNYPAAAYPKRAEVINKLNCIKAPIFELALAANFTPLPFVLLLENPPIDELDLPGWQASFTRNFCSLPLKDRLSLPHVYLSVLTHFIEMATGSPQDIAGYEPQMYKHILYPRHDDVHHPLFVFDPLETVSNLIDTLQKLWENQHEFIQNFKIFRLSQLNVLRGKTGQNSKWETLIAYCGNGKCKYAPLIFGVDESCECGKLICPECGLCDERCEHYMERKLLSSMPDEETNQDEIIPGILSTPDEPEFSPPEDLSFYEREDHPEDIF